jgi:TM2 domain-containing membrane protein YozV
MDPVQRTKDPAAIEARLLELAHTTDATLTAPALAYFAPCSIEDAARVLEDLAARDQLAMEIEDDGTIVYRLRGRQKLGAARPVPPPPVLTRVAGTGDAYAPVERAASPLLAGFLSAWIPGAGQLYAGRVGAAILWFLMVGIGYALIVPGLILHLFCIGSAVSSARRLNAAPPPHLLGPPIAYARY